MLVLMLSVGSLIALWSYGKSPSIGAIHEVPKVELPILMYHSVLKDRSKTGTYVITPDQLEQDLIYLQKHGYESVVMEDLIDYVNGEGTLPAKPVMLTFDDGHLNNVTYAAPLLEAYGMRAVMSVVGSYTQRAQEENDPNPSYAYVTWDQLGEISQNGLFEIQNHSYNLHNMGGKRNGTMQVRGESVEQYRQVLTDDIGRMQQQLEECIGSRPSTFTYPFGLISTNSRGILRELGFEATLTCEEGINQIVQGDPACLFGLKRLLRSGNDSITNIMKSYVVQ